ncbi:MAG: DUF3047 domain-containing protein [Candidatus Rokubacteria bacterium]|nr:DUF3047 domain-containing protein [Candidatus Rokubacteria bacterium]
MRVGQPLRSISLIVAVVIGVIGVVVITSPRHRAFYFGGLPDAAAPQALVTRGVNATLAVRQAAVTPPARTRLVARDGRLDVPLAEPVPWTLPADGPPPGWTLKEFAGQADIDLLRTDGRLALRLRSDRSSFALYRDVTVDLAEHPLLSWSWKTLRLPAGGDARVAGRDDQAAQIYVVFPRWPSPLTRSDVIGYVWDTNAPVDTRLTSLHGGNIKLIVVESGRQQVGQWRRYERNVAEDYAALFNRKAPRVGKIAVMIDSNDTRSDAEVLVAGLAFARPR